jgi:hypothetical protein
MVTDGSLVQPTVETRQPAAEPVCDRQVQRSASGASMNTAAVRKSAGFDVGDELERWDSVAATEAVFMLAPSSHGQRWPHPGFR